ncbi:MAG: hypothetical protein ABJA64_01370 [Candidatus Saccharibacteria bacterium]
MEFEKDTAITDEQRVLAATKNLTIEPLNSNIIREEEIDPPTIKETHANIGRDVEDTSPGGNLMQPSDGQASAPLAHKSRGHLFTTLFILAGLVAGVIGGAALFLSIG